MEKGNLNNFNKIREDFPILNQKINNYDLIYVDNSATTQKPKIVINEINNFYSKYNSNIHRSAHTLADISDKKFEDVRTKIANFINCEKTEVIFTSGATQSLNMIAFGLEDEIKENDEIVLSEMEHHANLVAWQEIAKRKKAILKFIPITKNFELDYKKAEELISNKTKVVSIIHVSNVLGTINDIEKIENFTKKVGAYFILDSTQAVPHLKINFKKINCDALVFSSHKMLGPTGVGVLIGKKKFLEKLKPSLFGGDMIDEVFLEKSTYRKAPFKFESGTPNISGVIGFGKAIEYLENIGMLNLENHEKELIKYFLEKIKEVKNFNLYGSKKIKNRIGVFSFNINGIHSHDLGSILDKNGIATRGGHHCAMPLHNKLNINSTTRISFYFYNTKDEINKIIEVLKNAKKIFDKGEFLLK